MTRPLHFENDQYIVHSFRPEDLERFAELAADVFLVLSDDHTLRYLPGKRLESQLEAEQYLRTQIINFHTGKNYLHFITDKQLGKVIGMIDVISPELAREHYRIEQYPYFIEFYLRSSATGCYLMTELLPVIVDQLLEGGIKKLGAVVNRENTAAKKVLKKARFFRRQPFDLLQDLYECN